MLFKGRGRNTDRKIQLMRKADTASTTRYSSGGRLKSRPEKAKLVSLPSLETLRKLTGEKKWQ
jgi:hypothetical protein